METLKHELVSLKNRDFRVADLSDACLNYITDILYKLTIKILNEIARLPIILNQRSITEIIKKIVPRALYIDIDDDTEVCIKDKFVREILAKNNFTVSTDTILFGGPEITYVVEEIAREIFDKCIHHAQFCGKHDINLDTLIYIFDSDSDLTELRQRVQ